MQKKLLIILLGVIVVVVLLAIFVVSPKAPQNNKYTSFTNQLKSKILSYTPNNELSVNTVRILNQINDSKVSDEDKYNALKRLEFYFSAEYSNTKDPSIRNFVANEIGGFAKINLAKFYYPNDFNIPCADPTCGNKLDTEIKNIVDLINRNEDIDKVYKDAIIKNLESAAYMPDSSKEDKTFGMKLVIQQLEKQNDKNASDAAVLLKNYYYNKYNIRL